METISFDGKKYPCRWIYLNLPTFKGSFLVSTEQLECQLFNSKWDYASREAVYVDEMIFFYVPVSLIAAEEARIIEFISQNI